MTHVARDGSRVTGFSATQIGSYLQSGGQLSSDHAQLNPPPLTSPSLPGKIHAAPKPGFGQRRRAHDSFAGGSTSHPDAFTLGDIGSEVLDDAYNAGSLHDKMTRRKFLGVVPSAPTNLK
jgi:hypothetical protein